MDRLHAVLAPHSRLRQGSRRVRGKPSIAPTPEEVGLGTVEVSSLGHHGSPYQSHEGELFLRGDATIEGYYSYGIFGSYEKHFFPPETKELFNLKWPFTLHYY